MMEEPIDGADALGTDYHADRNTDKVFKGQFSPEQLNITGDGDVNWNKDGNAMIVLGDKDNSTIDGLPVYKLSNSYETGRLITPEMRTSSSDASAPIDAVGVNYARLTGDVAAESAAIKASQKVITDDMQAQIKALQTSLDKLDAGTVHESRMEEAGGIISQELEAGAKLEFKLEGEIVQHFTRLSFNGIVADYDLKKSDGDNLNYDLTIHVPFKIYAEDKVALQFFLSI